MLKPRRADRRPTLKLRAACVSSYRQEYDIKGEARQFHSVTGVLLQSSEVLIADLVYLAAANEYIFGVMVFHAGQGTIAVGHRLAIVLGCSVVLRTAHTVADFPGPGLVSGIGGHGSEHTRDQGNT
jgi:hypothetical protein